MHHNTKGERIYYSLPFSSNNETLNLTLLGETIPSPTYEAMHRMGLDPRNNMYTFEFIAKGKLIITEGKKTHIAKEGDVLILNRTASHYYYTDSTDLVGKYFFVCNGNYVDKMMEVFGITKGTIIQPLNLSYDFINLFAVAQTRSQSLLTTVAELILKILYSINPLICEDAKNAPIESYPLHRQITNYIDTHIQEPLRLEDIANYFSTTPITINRIFKEHYHTTPKQYILTEKLEVSKQLLSGTQLPVNRISAYLSFYHQNHFANTFTKYTGLSPSQYRQQHPYIVHTPESLEDT